jgi:peroxiredoxin
MAQLRQDYAKFVALDSEVLVVGPEGPADFASYWEQEKLPFVGLADPEHVVARAYHQEVNAAKLGRMPAVLVIDKQGKVRFQRYGNAMQDIPSNDEVLALVARLQQEAV